MSPLLQQVLQEIDQLTPAEQMEVLGHLVERAKQYVTPSKTVRKWSDLKGMTPYPMVGGDAQEWVLWTRQEGDEHREKLLRGEL